MPSPPPESSSAEVPSKLNGHKSFRWKQIEWGEAVKQIKAGNPVGEEKLYEYLQAQPRHTISKQLDDKNAVVDVLHEVNLKVLMAIREDKVGTPEAMPGFIATIVLRTCWQNNHTDESQIAKRIAKEGFGAIKHQRPPIIETVPSPSNPEKEAMLHEEYAIARNVLENMPKKQQEVLTRFYLLDQGPKQIQEEMGLTDTQFRLMKWRAKAKFIEEGNRKMNSFKPHEIGQTPDAASGEERKDKPHTSKLDEIRRALDAAAAQGVLVR